MGDQINMDSNMSSATPRAAWLQRVSSIQQQKMTPAEVERIRHQATQQQRSAALAKRAKTLERTSTLCTTSLSWSPALRSPALRSSAQTAGDAESGLMRSLTVAASRAADGDDEADEDANARLDDLESSSQRNVLRLWLQARSRERWKGRNRL